MTRLVKQMEETLQWAAINGERARVVLWSQKEATMRKVSAGTQELGARTSQVQFVLGAEGLYRRMKFALTGVP